MSTKVKAICKRVNTDLVKFDSLNEWDWFYMTTLDNGLPPYLGVKIHGKRYYPHLRIYCLGDEANLMVRPIKKIVIKEFCTQANNDGVPF